VLAYSNKYKMLPPRVQIGSHKFIAFQTAVSDSTVASLQSRQQFYREPLGGTLSLSLRFGFLGIEPDNLYSINDQPHQCLIWDTRSTLTALPILTYAGLPQSRSSANRAPRAFVTS